MHRGIILIAQEHGVRGSQQTCGDLGTAAAARVGVVLEFTEPIKMTGLGPSVSPRRTLMSFNKDVTSI
jgi:hypothetical protein